MKVNFVTSGFPHGLTDDFISEIKKYLVSQKSFVFVASDFNRHARTKHYLEIFLRMFEEQGIVFEQAHIVDYQITAAAAVEIIKAADLVWLAGGPTLTQIAQIKEYGLVDALQKRDGITIGMSAGSINMARRVVLARDISDNVPELSIHEGIGLIDFNIEPHLNEASEEHLADIEEAAKVAPIYGLYDDSFILEIDGNMKIYGDYELFEAKFPD